ncbi:MAG: ABC transporter ATP-binding protein [Acidimicrobiales bacterium]
MSVIELEGVGRAFETDAGTVVALDHIDLDVDAGELLVVLGPSGCGKTTLLNLVGALDVPTSGTARVLGHDLTTASRKELFAYRRETVSFVFQSFNLFPGLTAEENVRFGAEVTGRDDPVGLARAMLDRVGLGERATHFPAQLSGGEQQRVAIARALATGNQVLLADEPTGELDFHTGVSILALLQEQADAGRTVVIVTHNRENARMADRVVELSGGHVVRDGAPADGKVPVDQLRW